MGDVAPTDALERGRADYDRRAWLDAFTALSEADRRNPLVAADLEMLAPAARCAIMIGLEFMNLGEAARANGWFSRATKTPLFAASSLADNPLQRQLRDINTVTQHFLVRSDTLTTAGAVLAGRDPALPIF
jgi:hypothetical protein